MSGQELRESAIHGRSKDIYTNLHDRANSCSADEFGLTPLMYACWNGHVECVKYLAANSLGINKEGQRCSSLNLVSVKGYTALHLTALDAPDTNNAAADIVGVLLLLGTDQTIRCREGLTALDIAKKLNRVAVIKAFYDFATQDEDMSIKMTMDDSRRLLKSKYTFHWDLRMQVEPFKANFGVPDFIFEPAREGYIPKGLHVILHCTIYVTLFLNS
jgi:hypothetical protein